MNEYQTIAMVITIATTIIVATHFLLNLGNIFLENLLRVDINSENSKGFATICVVIFLLYLLIGSAGLYSIFFSSQDVNNNLKYPTLFNIYNMSILNKVSIIVLFLLAAVSICIMVKFNYLIKKYLKKRNHREWLNSTPIWLIILSSMFCSLGIYNIGDMDMTFVLFLCLVYFLFTFIIVSLLQVIVSVYNMKISTMVYKHKDRLKEIECKIIREYKDFIVITNNGEVLEYVNKKNIEGIYTRSEKSSKDGDKVKNFKYIKFVITFTVLLVIILSVLTRLWINNLSYGDLLSFMGAIFGGTTTLIAIFVSTDQTRKIQQENYKFQQKNIRKEFADEIATNISEYISDIKLYYDMMEDKYKIRIVDKDKKINRTVSVQKAFLLRIKLKNVNPGKEVLNHINIIEKNYIDYVDNWDSNSMEEEINKLKDATVKFIDEY